MLELQFGKGVQEIRQFVQAALASSVAGVNLTFSSVPLESR
jgi:hypothetical protein